MTNLYIVSTEPYSGKSAICLGLAFGLQERGVKVGYMKPLGGLLRRVDDEYTDEDAYFIWKTLGIDAPWGLASPVLLTQELIEAPLAGPVTGLEAKIKKALKQLAKGRDLMILEGLANPASGLALGLPAQRVAELAEAKVLTVIRYHADLGLDGILEAQEAFGSRLLGAIVNDVPARLVGQVKERLTPFLERHGLALYGTLPQDKVLCSITVRELAEVLGGEVLCAHDHLDELVENFMVGAMNVDAALTYFRHTSDKAVITGGDRADIQLAALRTPTKCLILTGNLRPSVVVLGEAAEMGVPMVLVKGDTLSTTEVVERTMGRIRLSSPKQVERLKRLVDEHIDLAALQDALGIK